MGTDHDSQLGRFAEAVVFKGSSKQKRRIQFSTEGRQEQRGIHGHILFQETVDRSIWQKYTQVEMLMSSGTTK